MSEKYLNGKRVDDWVLRSEDNNKKSEFIHNDEDKIDLKTVDKNSKEFKISLFTTDRKYEGEKIHLSEREDLTKEELLKLLSFNIKEVNMNIAKKDLSNLPEIKDYLLNNKQVYKTYSNLIENNLNILTSEDKGKLNDIFMKNEKMYRSMIEKISEKKENKIQFPEIGQKI